MTDAPGWPREIWMAERDDPEGAEFSGVASELATVPRYAGDPERDREFHCYVDADVHDTAIRYHKEHIDTLSAQIRGLRSQLDAAAKSAAESERERCAQVAEEAVNRDAAVKAAIRDQAAREERYDARIDALTEEVERLRKAVQPLSDMADLLDCETAGFDGSDVFWLKFEDENGDETYRAKSIAVSDFYAARRVLSDIEGEK